VSRRPFTGSSRGRSTANLSPGQQACHNNGVKTDNRAANLRWDTSSENARDIVRHGKNHLASKTHCKRNHEFTPENTRIVQTESGTRRKCLACTREASAADFQRKKARGYTTAAGRPRPSRARAA
jgi:hypothetical protein